jgi:hypothetical protein
MARVESKVQRPARETRLLLVTIAVSAAVLVLLSQYRFPEQGRPEAPVQAPLDRLAARATYDELAAIIAQLERRIAPALLVLRVSTPDPPEAVPVLGSVRSVSPRTGGLLFVPAIRLSQNVALALIPPGARVQGIVGDPEGVPVVLAADALRGLAIVRVPPVADPAQWLWDRPPAIDAPRYVAVVEGTRGGPTLRPLFLGRTDPVSDPRWDRPLLMLGGLHETQPGSLIVSLDGRFIGLAVVEDGLPAVVPAETLSAVAELLSAGSILPAGDLGVQVQTLTPALARATGATHGAVISYIDPAGPAVDVLQVGDVVASVDDAPIFSPDRLLVQIGRTAPGTPLALRVVRRGAPLDVEVIVGAYEPAVPAAPRPDLGLVLRSVAGVGSEVIRVIPQTAAANAGLLPGDIITRLDVTSAPMPAQVSGAFASAESGDLLILGVERQARHLLLVLEKL